MNFKDKDAIYLQIADYISEHIMLGKWKPDEKIPSVREMAGELQVNPNTVMRTYEHLQNQEIIFNKRGMGHYVAIDAIKKIKTILDEYIRPAVEQDGGAIHFKSFLEGVVTVILKGSCSGCPSSTLTLKTGIENLLKRMVPEVTEVVSEAM